MGPWVAIGTSPAALMMGGGVAEGASGPALIAALALGVVALVGLAATQGVLGQRAAVPLRGLTAGPLGPGSSRRVASLVVLGMMVGWFGVNVGVAGTAVGRLLDVPQPVGVALFGGVTLAIVAFGLGALSWSALAAGLATTGLAAYGLALALDEREVSLDGPLVGTEPIGLVPGVALVVGYGAAFALRTPDFTHDLARPRQVIWCALAGLAVPLTLFALAGAVLLAATGSWNLADVLRDLGSPTIAYLFVAVGFSGSVLTNLHSGALSLTDVHPRLGHPAALLAIAGAGGALAAAGFADRMLEYLTLMALLAPGLVVLCLMHAMRDADRNPPSPRAGLVAWGAGAAAGIALDVAGFGLALPAAPLATAAVYRAVDRPRRRAYVNPTPEEQVGDTG